MRRKGNRVAENGGKYNDLLLKKVKEEKADERKQEMLKKRYGITGEVTVSEKGAGHIFLAVIFAAGKILAAFLAFVFLVVILSPTLRKLYFELPFFRLFS